MHILKDDQGTREIWHSTNGTSWSRLATAPAYGPRTGQAFAVLEGAADSLLAPATPGFSAAAGFSSQAFVTVGDGDAVGCGDFVVFPEGSGRRL